jgi:hypothetical protein
VARWPQWDPAAPIGLIAVGDNHADEPATALRDDDLPAAAIADAVGAGRR